MLLLHRPAAPLSFYVEALWDCESYSARHSHERVLPNGRCQIIISLADRGTMLAGIRSHVTLIETAAIQSMIGVLFWPGGARSVIDVPLDELHNRHVPLELVWGLAANALLERLCEAGSPDRRLHLLEIELQKRAERPTVLHPAVQHALMDLGASSDIRTVSGLARQTGISRRRLAQLFREQVGLTPKLYCRLHRFQRVVRLVGSGAPVDWADVALSGGFCDQAHMAHEFRAFSGLSPGEFLARERPFPNHVSMD